MWNRTSLGYNTLEGDFRYPAVSIDFVEKNVWKKMPHASSQKILGQYMSLPGTYWH